MSRRPVPDELGYSLLVLVRQCRTPSLSSLEWLGVRHYIFLTSFLVVNDNKRNINQINMNSLDIFHIGRIRRIRVVSPVGRFARSRFALVLWVGRFALIRWVVSGPYKYRKAPKYRKATKIPEGTYKYQKALENIGK